MKHFGKGHDDLNGHVFDFVTLIAIYGRPVLAELLCQSVSGDAELYSAVVDAFSYYRHITYLQWGYYSIYFANMKLWYEYL